MALGPGSIAFVGFNADGNDNLAFVALEPIVAGTVIYFQDNEWNGSAIGAGGAFNGGESAWHWTASADIVAGSVVTIDDIGSGTVSSNLGSVVFDDAGNRGLSNDGDTVYAYVGTSAAPSAFLSAVTNGTFASNGSIANTGLTAGVDALQFGGARDIFSFSGARDGQANFSDYAAVINNPSNWIFQDGSGDQSADASAPNVPFSLDAFSVTAAAPVLESITLAADTVSENGSVNVTVTLSAAAQADTMVTLAFEGDASDLGSFPASVTVAAGATTAVATLVVGDDADTQNDAFIVTAALNDITKQASGTIIDDDAPSTVLDIDLSQYVRVGRYALPEPTRTAAPSGNLLTQEASGVTYDWDTDTLFIVGDGGRSVTQVSKTGQLIDTMTLASGSSPQGTEFYDTEGITYIGNGEFVFTEERDRQIVKFTYEAGTTLHRADTQTVDLGTFVDNTGLEGLSYDPLTGGYILVKEISPEGIFQTDVDFAAGTATNGSPTTENSINLFNPSLTGLSDFADVYALSNLTGLDASQTGDLLVLSQQDGRVVLVDRAGNVLSSLQIVADVDSPLSVADEQHEGITMDRDGNIYIVNENGGGDIDHPQLWVYAKSSVPNQAPTEVVLNNAIGALVENTTTAAPVKVADIVVVDDGLGTNHLTLTGDDAGYFDIINGGLYIKAGTVLDYEAKTSYSVTVNVDDASLGTSPDATANYTLSITDVVNETPVIPNVYISEVHPSGSGNGSYAADWFEVTNNGTVALDITGWQMDDNSNGSGKVALRGVTSIAAGQSVIFIEGTADGSTDASIIANFSTAWFGSATLPTGVVIGAYGGSGVGLSTGGDAVNLFDAAGNRVTGVSFGVATDGVTFDNHAGLGSETLPLPTVSDLSAVGVDGAFRSADNGETGSPGTVGTSAPEIDVRITEVAPWSSGDSPVGADWFEVTNFGATAVDLTGWRMDDSSQSFVGSVALNGITSIAAGESVIFIESSAPSTAIANFINTWFGGNVPAGLQIGTYSGSGVGLSTDGDAVNLYDNAGALQASVNFGASDSSNPLSTFDNAAGADHATISQLSAVGANGGAVAAGDANEIGSPGTIISPPPEVDVRITEVAPWSSGNSPVGADWFELTNFGDTAIDLTGWRMDDDSHSFGSAVALHGITTLAAGESVIFIESGSASITTSFLNTWFGGNVPAGLQIGTYSGSGVGLSTGGDQVNIYDSAGTLQANVNFGASDSSAPYSTFDNAAGANNATISQLSAVGTNGAAVAAGDANEIGSPGTLVSPLPEVDVRITEVAPWSSGNSPVGADWFELTNFGDTAIDLTGWRMDDDSHSFGSAVALHGITTLAAGESVIFIESSSSSITTSFLNTWFGGNVPAGLQVGTYSGSGVGLSTGGDQVNIYDSTGTLQANVSFGASDSSAPYSTFDNAAGANNATISQLSAVGTNGANVAAGDTNEIGSPGTLVTPPPEFDVRITEVAPWSSGNSPVGADWFELTNFGDTAIDLTGWRMDDDSHSFGSAVALHGITTLAAGESVIFIESSSSSITTSFLNTWFGGNVPAGLQIGTYSGSGVGLSTGGDQVNIYDSTGTLQANVSFGASDSSAPYSTFDNAAGADNATLSQLSAVGTNGAAVAAGDASEIGSPGTIANPITPVAADDDYSSLAKVGETLHIAAPGVLDNDTSEHPALAELVSGPQDGLLVFNEDGSFDFTAFSKGTTSFTYRAVDGGQESDVATVTITTTEFNSANTLDLSAATTNQIKSATGAISNVFTGSGNDALVGNSTTGGILNGGDGNDIIKGGAKSDVIIGGAGTDKLTGGAGDDIFVFRLGFGHDTISDFAVGSPASHDTLDLRGLGFDTFQAVLDATTTDGANAVIHVGADDITLQGVTKVSFAAHMFDLA